MVSNAICSDDEREKETLKKLDKIKRKFVADKRLQRARHEQQERELTKKVDELTSQANTLNQLQQSYSALGIVSHGHTKKLEDHEATIKTLLGRVRDLETERDSLEKQRSTKRQNLMDRTERNVKFRAQLERKREKRKRYRSNKKKKTQEEITNS